MDLVPTSEGTLLSTIHGRDRRKLRSIGKSDLLAAKKYGTRERSYLNRWKFTFAGIVYITENDEITEVTSYAIPIEIERVTLTHHDYRSHEALANKMREMPSICTSHIVVVIDQSASMRKCDVFNYKTRSDAVYATMALDYIGNQIDKRQTSNANYTDAVTLIEMHESSSIIFYREPCTNVLYNKFIDRKSSVKPSGHGMFLDALDCALHAFRQDQGNDSCTLMLMFLSDGKPSDQLYMSGDQTYTIASLIGDRVFEICSKFGQQLSVHTFGFAQQGSDFTVLEHMAQRARDAGSGGSFEAVDTRGHGLSTSITNLSDTMSETRKMASLLHLSKTPKTIREIGAEPERGSFYLFHSDHDNISDGSWKIYDEGYNRLTWSAKRQRLVAVGDGEGVCIRNLKFGFGAERVVFRAVELVQDSSGRLIPAPERLVAKECKFEEDLSVEGFHELFCRTQRQASKLADKFNELVRKKCHIHKIAIPAKIQFLQCYVYEVPEEIEGKLTYRTVLIEKRLDPSQYSKWNSNNGFVKGPQKLADILNRQLVEPKILPHHKALEVIEECSEESEDDRDKDKEEIQEEESGEKLNENQSYCISAEDVPQAFSHHTYRYTQRCQLVCDLQGVLDTSLTPPVFELTDPVIHTNDKSGKSIFGRTDHGHKGMRTFMKTHICNDLCKLLGISQFH